MPRYHRGRSVRSGTGRFSAQLYVITRDPIGAMFDVTATSYQPPLRATEPIPTLIATDPEGAVPGPLGQPAANMGVFPTRSSLFVMGAHPVGIDLKHQPNRQVTRPSAVGLKDTVSTGGDGPIKWHGLPMVVVTPAGKSAVRPHAIDVGYFGADGSEGSPWWGGLSITGPYRQYVVLGPREEEETHHHPTLDRGPQAAGNGAWTSPAANWKYG